MAIDFNQQHGHSGIGSDGKKIKYEDLQGAPIEKGEVTISVNSNIEYIVPATDVIFDCTASNFAELTPTATTNITFANAVKGGLYTIYLNNTSNYTINFAAYSDKGVDLRIFANSGTKPAVSVTGKFIMTVFATEDTAYFFFQGPMAIFTN